MLKKQMLKKNWQFKAIINNEKQVITKYLILYYKPIDDDLKVGISISKKFANAVKRNKYKRQVKNILTKLPIWTKKFEIVLILRKEFLPLKFEDKIIATEEIFKKFK